MGLSWGDDPVRPTVPQLENRLAVRLMDALDPPSTCTNTYLYGSRSLARQALRSRRRGLLGRWRYRHWEHWTCMCGWFHIGPKGNRAA